MWSSHIKRSSENQLSCLNGLWAGIRANMGTTIPKAWEIVCKNTKLSNFHSTLSGQTLTFKTISKTSLSTRINSQIWKTLYTKSNKKVLTLYQLLIQESPPGLTMVHTKMDLRSSYSSWVQWTRNNHSLDTVGLVKQSTQTSSTTKQMRTGLTTLSNSTTPLVSMESG